MSRDSAPSLTGQLLALGRTRTGGVSQRTRRIVLAIATAALTAVLLGLAVIAATFDGRDLRDAMRQPVLTTSPEQAAAWWRERPDSAGRWQHSVVYLVPVTPAAPPPPGLDSWPGPGQVYLSPALADPGLGVRDRYGEYAGTIGPRGLLSPTERLAYVGMPEDAAVPEDWMHPITGFGPPGYYLFGEKMTLTPAAQDLMTAVYLVFVVLPAAGLFVVAARFAAAGRDRRAALLNALGARTRHQFLVGLSSCLPAILAGTALGSAVAVPVLLTDVVVPGIDYTVRAADVRRMWWFLVVAVVVSAAAAASGYAALHARRARRGTTRPRPAADRVATWKIALFALFTVVTSAAALIPAGSPWTLPVYAVGLLGALAFAPSALAALLARVGAAVAHRGLRTGRPTWIVAGRWCQHRPGVLARLVAPVVIGVVTLVNMHYFLASETLTSVQARQANERLADSALQVSAHDLTAQRVMEADRSLPERARLMAVDTADEGEGPTVLRAPCSTLRSLRLDCPQQPTPVEPGTGDLRFTTLVDRQVNSDVRIQASPAPPVEGSVEQLAVLSPREDPLTLTGVRNTLHPVLGPTTQIDRLASLEMTPANARLSQWGVLLGSYGMALLATAGLISAGGHIAEAARSIAPLSVLTGRRRWHLGIALGFLTAPMALAAILSAALSLPLGTVIQQNRQVPVAPPDTLGAIVLGALALALAAGLAAGTASARTAATWRPGRR
ncbi:hypothetical protein HNR06_004387 [Nocardiopsis arvandica]|uniref:Permease n=1 Tax=Nocardiopsis sinuspersici TaxID=501010 RepID=A0A7Z0BKF6_9ACTN|nr:hypothetical protein [Nocardiopsis sinuspersici]NYH54798.1 hypothetical protein [Nocardiopsis sinuspersici]